MPRLALTAHTLDALPGLHVLAVSGTQLGKEDVDRWVGWWETSGVL